MGRPPIGKRAMTATERSHRYRAKHAATKPATKKSEADTAALAENERLKAEIERLRAANVDAEKDREIDPATLSMSAQKKLDAAIRATTKRLEREYDAKGIKENMEHWERMFPTLEREQREAAEMKRTYQQFMQEQKKIFTSAEFKLILMCLHPDGDRSAAKRADAFRSFNVKRFALTGEK